MEHWLVDLIRSDEEPGPAPEPGEGTVLRWTGVDKVGLIELDAGPVVAFLGLSEEGTPEEGLAVYADEFRRHEKFGWTAGEVVTASTHRSGREQTSDDEPGAGEAQESGSLIDWQPPREDRQPMRAGRPWTPPDPDYPDVEQVRARIDELVTRYPSLSGLAAPAVFLRPESEADVTGRTRFQGRPRVPSDVEWPHSPDGPIRFAGQLDFAELHEVHQGECEDLPEEGMLALFADKNFSMLGDEYWDLVYLPNPEQGKVLEPPLEELDTPPVAVDLQKYPTLPEPWDHFAPEQDASADGLDDALWQFFSKSTPSPRHQVAGHTEWVQYDDRQRCERKRRRQETGDDSDDIDVGEEDLSDWRVLWTIEDDSRLHRDLYWGDVGILYVMMRRQDLADRNFEAAQAVVQGA